MSLILPGKEGKKIVLYGAGGDGKVILEIAEVLSRSLEEGKMEPFNRLHNE